MSVFTCLKAGKREELKEVLAAFFFLPVVGPSSFPSVKHKVLEMFMPLISML